MQLKGLVRFFTILLVLYSIYQLSFTWFVRAHENKLKDRAERFVKAKYPEARSKKPDEYPDSVKAIYDARMRRLEDSTKDVTLTYGLNGSISYQKAKESELNLGLDLQGGMNVTLEVEMTGLLKSMSNNSTDPGFLKALDNANRRKANSNADFVTLFYEEYQKLNPNGRLASIFATANQNNIKITDNNATIISKIRTEAKNAFDRTYKILRARIDQFGVAQPSINPDPDRAIITVELPGVKDQERVRNYLQATANLQFWEVYTLETRDYANAWQNGIKVFENLLNGTTVDTTKKADTTATAKADTALKKSGDTIGKSTASQQKTPGQKKIADYIQIASPYQDNGKAYYPPYIGSVAIKDTAIVRSYLENPAFRSLFPSDAVWLYGIANVNPNNNRKADRVPLYAIKTYGKEKARLEGDAVSDASQDYDQTTQKVEVKMAMNTSGAKIWAKMTEENVGKPIAIVLDNVVYSAPNVQNKIDGGNSSISGSFTTEEAQDLANILKIGKLPAPAKIVQEEVVGPTLGRDAINGGLKAFTISFVVIFLLMLIYYNTSGWIANIALILNLLFTIGVLTGLGATLTAPGIAGLVLTIGMAVDTNVIIYERIKEELTRGKGYIPAVNEGYRRSLPPVLDAHVTVLLTAIILFSFGLGPVKGFATTQILGILLSLFCGILVSRWVTDWFTDKKRHLEYFTGVSKRIFQHANFKFIEYRKIAYGISVVVLVLGIGSFFHGFDEGVEFKGGRSFKIRFAEKISDKVEKLRDDLKVTLGEAPVLKTVGDNRTLDITSSYLINDTRTQADSLVEVKLYGGLKNYLPAGLSFSQFDKNYKLGSKKVLPTISDDLKQGAKRATIFALLIISLYIFIRFRDWRYSLGTIVSLLHDVLVTLAVFSFARNLVPFPLEIDQHFIAAVLTVIGFSMNDTVIVFDRIREYAREMSGATKEEIINNAINHTLSRTIMTSLTVFLTLLILFLVGGEVTRGFAFAMLVGVITGTYSSVFVAAPILVDLARKRPLGKADTVVEVKQKPSPTPSSKPATAK
ncbi:MAG: protein translocase subunit SecDF [Bacteroidetes bacterium]|nr:MAG: protein translocase subunit SecDF [Bacteroidota bacterium]